MLSRIVSRQAEHRYTSSTVGLPRPLEARCLPPVYLRISAGPAHRRHPVEQHVSSGLQSRRGDERWAAGGATLSACASGRGPRRPFCLSGPGRSCTRRSLRTCCASPNGWPETWTWIGGRGRRREPCGVVSSIELAAALDQLTATAPRNSAESRQLSQLLRHTFSTSFHSPTSELDLLAISDSSRANSPR